jgi:hypothetical protein
MRRPVASLLLMLILAGLCVPALQAQSQVPACCRRGGQHHCRMNGASPSPDEFRSLANCCLYRHPRALRSHGNPALGSLPSGVVSLLAADNVVLLPETRQPRNVVLANPQRGPPAC